MAASKYVLFALNSHTLTFTCSAFPAVNSWWHPHSVPSVPFHPEGTWNIYCMLCFIIQNKGVTRNHTVNTDRPSKIWHVIYFIPPLISSFIHIFYPLIRPTFKTTLEREMFSSTIRIFQITTQILIILSNISKYAGLTTMRSENRNKFFVLKTNDKFSNEPSINLKHKKIAFIVINDVDTSSLVRDVLLHQNSIECLSGVTTPGIFHTQ